jgi:hypothetical protein
MAWLTNEQATHYAIFDTLQNAVKIRNLSFTQTLAGVQITFYSSNNKHCIRFEVLTAVSMKNGVFWDVTP